MRLLTKTFYFTQTLMIRINVDLQPYNDDNNDDDVANPCFHLDVAQFTLNA
jgi:hypothetical protein